MKLELYPRHALLVPETDEELAAIHQIAFQSIASTTIIDRLPHRAKLMFVLRDPPDIECAPPLIEPRSPRQLASEDPRAAVELFDEWLKSRD